MKYLIWSLEHRMWWGPMCCGYTNIMALAGRYELKEAIEITQSANAHVDPTKPPLEAIVPEPTKTK